MPDFNRISRFFEFFMGAGALIGVFIFLQLSMSAELIDPDIWLHLKTGEYIVQHKSVPHADLYSASTHGIAWIDHSPLTQAIFYQGFKSGGPDRLISISCLVMFLAFFLLWLCVYKDRETFSLSIIVLALAVFASRTRFNIRPENFSVLFFCAYLFILSRRKNNKWVFILPLLQLAWVNCHGFFMLGLFLIVLFIIAEWLKRRGGLPWEWSNGEPEGKNALRNLIAAFGLSALACLLNPNGLAGALYPLKIILNRVHPNILNNYIFELLPPWKLGYNRVFVYYLLLALSSFSFLLNLKKINLAYLLCWLALLGISFNISRNIIFFNCIACLACVDNFSRISYRQFTGRDFPRNLFFILKCTGISLVLLCAAGASKNILDEQYYLFDQHRFKSRLLGISSIYPEKAADFIKLNKLPDNLFNFFNHGSYLIYRLYPEHHVFIDGRSELYSREFSEDYYRIIYTDPSTIEKLLKKYQINTLLLSERLTVLEELATYLYQSKKWVLVYLNEDGLIFVRDTPENKELTGRLKIDLDKWEIKKADLGKVPLGKVLPGVHVRLAQLLFALGNDQKARLQAEEALKLLPSSPEANAIMGKIYLRQNDMGTAYQYLRLAFIYDQESATTLTALADYFLKSGDRKTTLEIYKKIIRLFPEYARGYYLAGSYYENAGDLKAAAVFLNKAVKLAPYSQEFLNKYNALLAKIQAVKPR